MRTDATSPVGRNPSDASAGERSSWVGIAAAVVVVIAAVLAVQGPVLWSDGVAILADPYLTPPWRALAPSPGSGHANLVADSLRFSYPSWHFTHQELWAGRLPLWNPYLFCGHDNAAAIQPAAFSPVRLAFSLLPPGRGMSLHLLAHTLLLALATLAFLRGRGSSPPAAAIGGLVVTLSGYLLSKWGQPTVVTTFAWLPVMLLLVDRLRRGPSWRPALALAASAALCFLAGHTQVFVLVALVVVLFSLTGLARDGGWKLSRGRIAGAAATLALFVLMACPPIVAYYSAGEASREVVGGSGPGPSLLQPSPRGGWSLFTPEPFGSPVAGTFEAIKPMTTPDEDDKRLLWFAGGFLYPGVLFWLAAPLALWRLRGHPFVPEAAVMAVAAYGLTFVDPLPDGVLAVPGLGFSPVDRLLAVGAFGLALICAAGVEALAQAEPRRSLLLIAAGVLVALFGLGMIVWLADVPAHGVRSALRTAIWVCGGAVLLSAAAARRWSRRNAGWVALALLCLELIPLARGYFPTLPERAVLPPTKTTRALSERLGRGRLARFRTLALRPDTAQVFQLRDTEGFAPLYSGLYRRLVGAWRSGGEPDPRMVGPIFDRAALGSPLLPLLGVRFLLAEAPLDHPAWRLAFRGEGVFVHESRAPAARLRVLTRWRVVESTAEMEALLASERLDPLREAVLLAVPDRPAHPAPTAVGPAQPGTARIVHETPRRVEIEALAPQGGLLLLADTYHPAWRAWVNGNPTMVRLADLALRAVELPPGESRITFVYRPQTLLAASWTSAGAGLLVIVLLAWPSRRHRKPPAPRSGAASGFPRGRA